MNIKTLSVLAALLAFILLLPACGSSSNNNENATTTLDSPPPASVAVNEQTLSWPTASGAAFYTVQQSTDGKIWTTIAEPQVAAGTMLSGDFSSRYVYRVLACDSARCIVWANTANRTAENRVWVEESTAAPWVARSGFSHTVFNNKLWIMGGLEDQLQFKNDVWSSTNGINWVQESTAAPWAARRTHSSTVFQDKIWLIGGLSHYPGHYPGGFFDATDVWSSTNGVNWVQESANAPWAARSGHTSAVFGGKLWVIGGLGADHNNKNDLWSLDVPFSSQSFPVTVTDNITNSQFLTTVSWGSVPDAAIYELYRTMANNSYSSYGRIYKGSGNTFTDRGNLLDAPPETANVALSYSVRACNAANRCSTESRSDISQITVPDFSNSLATAATLTFTATTVTTTEGRLAPDPFDPLFLIPITVTTTESRLTMDYSIKQSIFPAGDNDYYRFTQPSSSVVVLHIYTLGEMDTYGYLYTDYQAGDDLDGCDEYQAGARCENVLRDDDSGLDTNFSLSQVLSTSSTNANVSSAAKTYYLRVRGSDPNTTGDYRLFLKTQ